MSSGGKGGTNANSSIFDISNALFQGAGKGTTAAYNNYSQLAGYNPKITHTAIANASQLGPAATYDPTTAQAGIASYMNPYEDTVVNNSIADVNRLTQMQQQQNAAGAAAAGAFGGSRHGLVEAETNRAAQQNIADLAGNLRYQGYTTAADLANQDAARAQAAASENTGAQNAFDLVNKQAEDAFSQFNATNKNTTTQNNANRRDNARLINLAGARGMLDAAGQGGQLASGGVDIGRALNSDLLTGGNAQQNLLQQIINSAQGMFGGYTGQGNTLLNATGSAVSGSPLAGTGTTTQNYQPGLFDYLGLGAQTAGTLYNPAKTATSGGKK